MDLYGSLAISASLNSWKPSFFSIKMTSSSCDFLIFLPFQVPLNIHFKVILQIFYSQIQTIVVIDKFKPHFSDYSTIVDNILMRTSMSAIKAHDFPIAVILYQDQFYNKIDD